MKPKVKFFIICFLLFALAVLLFPVLLNYPNQYSFERGKVYFGGKEIPNFNKKQYKYLTYNVIKDSQNVYFNGEIVPWADAQTFISLDNHIFKDKNGIYYTTQGYYSKNKLKPVNLGLDIETFTYLGGYLSLIYKDKNGLYICNNDPRSLFKTNTPLVKINIPELDAATFVQLEDGKGQASQYWYADSSAVYWGEYGQLKPCKEIDRKSFQILTYHIFKDKNQVYYLTNYLESPGKQRTQNPAYTVLEEADPFTFNLKKQYSNLETVTKGNIMTFEDKNYVWSVKRFRTGGRRTFKGYKDIIYKQKKQ